MISDKVNKMRQKGQELKEEVRTRTLTYIMAGVGFVVGLAWNDAIKASIDYLFPLDKNSLLAKFAYAIIVTTLLVIAAKLFTKRTGETGRQ